MESCAGDVQGHVHGECASGVHGYEGVVLGIHCWDGWSPFSEGNSFGTALQPSTNRGLPSNSVSPRT